MPRHTLFHSWRLRLGVFVCLAFALEIAGVAVAANRTDTPDPQSLLQRLRGIKRKRSSLQRKLDSVRRRRRQVARELARIDASLDRTEARLRAVNREAQRARVEFQRAVLAYQAANLRLSNHRQLVSERLVVIHQHGEPSPLEILLTSTSFNDFANRLYLLDQVVSRDSEILASYEGAVTEAEARQTEVANRQRELAALQEQMKLKQRATSAQRDAKDREKRSLLSNQAVCERALAELEQDSREITAMLRRLGHTREGRARLATPWRGKLQRPVEGHIVSRFGYRVHPIFKVRRMHTGIDIDAASGARIKAAAGGVVVHAARWGGYGNCVIIDHGGGLATLYAHCSSLSVSVGQEVKQGQVIARVGSTGISTGPHLHFEVRRDGRPVDPEGML